MQTTLSPRIFLTDYNSYNNGTQFQFGHWVDLTQFSDEKEIRDYINDHFEECDKKSPLSSPREEIMITDYEGFHSYFYSESMSIEIMDTIRQFYEKYGDMDNIGQWLEIHNEYCSESNMDSYIHENNEDFFNLMFSSADEAVRAAIFGDYNYHDDYVCFNGYGNLKSLNEYNLDNMIDKDVLIEWMIDNL